MKYAHAIIAHGKALAECLSEGRPLSDSKYRRTFFYLAVPGNSGHAEYVTKG